MKLRVLDAMLPVRGSILTESLSEASPIETLGWLTASASDPGGVGGREKNK